VREAYSPAGGTTFRELWVTHINALSSYAPALQRNDTAAQNAARATLDTYNRDYGAAISQLTGGELGPLT
jgi:hypothetical protein